MSTYPPPQSAASNRAAWKAQRRAAKQQARLLREQRKQHRRLAQPRSIVGPLILLSAGILILLVQLGRVSLPNVVEWYARWWPLVLVATGVILLAEWALDTSLRQDRQPYRRRSLGGGVVFLLFVLILLGVGSRKVYEHFTWGSGFWGFTLPSFDEAFGEEHDFDTTLSSGIDPAATLIIRNPHGDVTVTGSSDDGQVHVTVHEAVHARSEASAASRETGLQPFFAVNGKDLALNVPNLKGGRADLTIQLPRTNALTINADEGDVNVQEMHANLSIAANHGDVQIEAIDGEVTAYVNNRHSDFSAHSITGTLHLDGHAGDVKISDINGSVTVSGDFFGDTHLEHVNGSLQFESTRTQLTAARLDGDLDLDSERLDGDQMVGPIVLTTRYGKDISLARIEGDVRISNGGKGSISLTSASPLGEIDITNSHGSVDLGIPSSAGFTVDAQTTHGSIENDFNMKAGGTEDIPQLEGSVGSAGAQIHIVTADGDITLRKAAVASLPPAPPSPPRITIKTPKKPAAPSHNSDSSNWN